MQFFDVKYANFYRSCRRRGRGLLSSLISRLKNPIYSTEKIGKARMKIDKGNFHFRQGKDKMCSVNSESLSCLANLFFGFGTTFRSCPVLVKLGEVRMQTGTLPVS